MLLREVAALLRRNRYRVVNVDATVIAQAPRMAPHIAAMRANLAQDLGIALDAVSVKAKTTEKLGFVGRGEGIAAEAVALIGLAMYSPPYNQQRGPRRAAGLHARQQLRRCWSPAPGGVAARLAPPRDGP